MTALFVLILALRMRAVLPPDPHRMPVPQINREETNNLALHRKRLFRAPRI